MTDGPPKKKTSRKLYVALGFVALLGAVAATGLVALFIKSSALRGALRHGLGWRFSAEYRQLQGVGCLAPFRLPTGAGDGTEPECNSENHCRYEIIGCRALRPVTCDVIAQIHHDTAHPRHSYVVMVQEKTSIAPKCVEKRYSSGRLAEALNTSEGTAPATKRRAEP